MNDEKFLEKNQKYFTTSTDYNNAINLSNYSETPEPQISEPKDKTDLVDVNSSRSTNQTQRNPRTKEEIFDIGVEVIEFLKLNIQIEDQLDLLMNILMKHLSKYDISFPKIRVKLVEDSIAMNWIVDKGYFAANIVNDESESSWTLIELEKNVRGYEADGYLNDDDLEMYIRMVIEFMGKFIV